MRIFSGNAAAARVRRLAIRGAQLADVEPTVAGIIADVRKRGDRAVRKYAEQWDGLRPKQSLRVSDGEIDAALLSASSELKAAVRVAAGNIRRFAEGQRPKAWSRTHEGITTGQIARPLDSVGCYVPGGRYPLISTVLMTVIPAQVASVPAIRMASPRPRPEVLAAAAILGVREIYRIGGAQAVAALAYGTRSIPRVDKIVGPGNLYVTAAKKLVSFDCSIDLIAGPTEGLVVSDVGTPEFIASDLVAQSEHDPEALAIFITTREDLARRVSKAADQMSRDNPIAKQSLQHNGVILVSASREQSFEWANDLAVEHITVDPSDVGRVRNAGSIFVGDYSPQAAGDYASGTNHVLPTGTVARFRGGLSVADFVKLISVQKLSRAGLKGIAPAIETLAITESLQAHANSIRVRCGNA
jgi:histidinol dehydrogenase